MERRILQLSELDDLAAAILVEAGENRVFCFHGEMGAGKTTLINSFCKVLGCRDIPSSPTFSIVQEYADRDGKPLYHFDFYRLEHLSEAFDLGYEDYLYSGNYCFIEWPEKIEGLLNLPKADIFITVEDEVRIIRTSYG